METNLSYREICKQFVRRFLFASILIYGFSVAGFAQTEVSEEKLIVIPDQAMEQVVRRILTWYFKPRNQKRVIYLAEKGLQKSWLPEIKGIEFQLLSAEDIEEKEGVYFFTKLELSESKYQIGFAFGEPDCNRAFL